MTELIAANAAACFLAVAGIFAGVAILWDRLTTRRWQPIEVDRGEIVERGDHR